MFDPQKDRVVQHKAEKLAERLNARCSEDALRDANFSLSYGQFDGFVSNVVAASDARMIALTRDEADQIKELVVLLDMKNEIKDLREYLTEKRGVDISFKR